MTKEWPSFITRDLGRTVAADTEMHRRWKEYDRAMKALIAAGGVHQDADGWWVDDATGELIGPDPEIERPLSDEEISRLRPFSEVFPELAQKIEKRRRQKRESARRIRREDKEDVEAVRLFRERLARGEEELLPWEFVARLSGGDNRVLAWREYRGLSIDELAARAGISTDELRAIEGDTSLVRRPILENLAAALRTDVEDLTARPHDAGARD